MLFRNIIRVELYYLQTDIAFNPEKSINCQARAAAVYVSLREQGLLKKALENKETFLDIVYGKDKDVNNAIEQLSLLDKF